MTVGEARDLITYRAKFGDEESIKARDMLRIVHDLEQDEIWLTCCACGGSGVAELTGQLHADGGTCKQCEGEGEHVLKVTDYVTEEDLEELKKEYL